MVIKVRLTTRNRWSKSNNDATELRYGVDIDEVKCSYRVKPIVVDTMVSITKTSNRPDERETVNARIAAGCNMWGSGIVK